MAMPIISKPLYVYLQRLDDGAWVTVGHSATLHARMIENLARLRDR
jgi:hypothetical protein